jgi:uncharacterized OsmC-like protein/alpha-beta hydrolase superfamily lysophospholipase
MTAKRSEKVTFLGGRGDILAARLDLPHGQPKAFALFAHCFTCSKDVFAAARIAGALAERGIAVLRFDFTGLGGSDGEFANTNFSSNIEDLRAAAEFLRQKHQAPRILIGHSLGGAAVLAAARDVPEAVAVATINAPCDPGHVVQHFSGSLEVIEEYGEAEVDLGGRPFRIRKQFLDDISEANMHGAIASLKKALLIFHAPRDVTVGIDNAGRIFQTAKHPKSFVSLDDADHLLSRRQDAAYVAEVIAAWATRYLGDQPAEEIPAARPGTVMVAETGRGKFAQTVSMGGRHRLTADEPAANGGDDSGPTPYEFLLAGLGACTAMTVRMYADRKGLPLERVAVTLGHEKIDAGNGRIDRIEREIEITGDLDEATRQRLLEIANKCPVHRTLHSEVLVESRLK